MPSTCPPSSDATSRAATYSSEPGSYPVPCLLDIRLEPLGEIPTAVTVHVGTKAVAARVARTGPYAQLRLQERVVAARGDRVVLRTDTTVGGGVVLDPAPPRRLNPARLAALDEGTPEEIVGALVHEPVTEVDLQARGLPPGELRRRWHPFACRRLLLLG